MSDIKVKNIELAKIIAMNFLNECGLLKGTKVLFKLRHQEFGFVIASRVDIVIEVLEGSKVIRKKYANPSGSPWHVLGEEGDVHYLVRELKLISNSEKVPKEVIKEKVESEIWKLWDYANIKLADQGWKANGLAEAEKVLLIKSNSSKKMGKVYAL